MNSSIDIPGPELLVRRGLREVGRLRLCDRPLVLGRAPTCDVVLPHSSVSRRHAELLRQDEHWLITDLGSTNGIIVNGQPRRSAQLRPGDVIDIRPFSLNLLGEDTTAQGSTFTFAPDATMTTRARLAVAATSDVGQRLGDLYHLTRLVMNSGDDELRWQSFQETLERTLGTQRCVLLGYDATGGLYRLVPGEQRLGGYTPLDVSRTVVNDVVDSGHALLIESVRGETRFATAESLAGGDTGSVLCVPVIPTGKTRAIIYAARHFGSTPFNEEDLRFAVAVSDLAATAIARDEWQAQAGELARMRGRLEAARELQEWLLPHPIPQPAWGSVAARNYPAEQMSGDVYDVCLDAHGRLITALADVSGKGVPAALVATILQNTLRLSIEPDLPFSDLIERLNTVIYQQTPDDAFVTLVLCRWPSDCTRVEVANAGHPAPLCLRHDGTCVPGPEKEGLALGVTTPWRGRPVELDASEFERVLLYSDGALECPNADGEEFGRARLAERLTDCSSLTDEDLLVALAEDIQRFCAPAEPSDDVTLLTVRRTP